MLHATTPQEWGEWVWWMHIPYFLVVSGMALFLRLYLGAGRLWLLAALIALRAAVLVLNFFSEPSFTLRAHRRNRAASRYWVSRSPWRRA